MRKFTDLKIIKIAGIGAIVLFVVAGPVIWKVLAQTRNRVQVEVNIHINENEIYLSAFAEPPQFAIWLENPESGKCQLVFVTYRASRGDWEGKSDVPVALPRWSSIFRGKDSGLKRSDEEITVSGATPKAEYFRVRAEVKPESEWILWMEMNLAGDYNEFYPQTNPETMMEDEYACGQPALLYRAEIKAAKGAEYTPEIVSMSIWNKGVNTVVPVDATITTAQNVFDRISVQIIRPKPVIINTKKVEQQDVLNNP